MIPVLALLLAAGQGSEAPAPAVVSGAAAYARTRQPVRRAVVQLQPVRSLALGSPASRPSGAWTVEADRLQLAGVQVGDYHLAAERSEYPMTPVLALLLATGQGPEAPAPAAVSGTVLDAKTRQPVRRAVVQLQPVRSLARGSLASRPSGAWTVEADRLQLAGVQVGDYHLAAERSEYPMTPVLALPLATGQGPEAPAPAAVSGTVLDAKTRQPVRRAMVQLQPVRSRERGSMTLRPAGALTDEEGRFRIVGVQPGEYTLAAERNGYLGGRFGASGGRPQARGKTIQLTAGDVKNHLTIELMPHAVLAGRVVDDLGEPVLGALVTAARRRGAAGRARWSGENSTTTNDRGEFRLHGLAAGTYVIAAAGGRGLTLAQESGEVAYVTTYFPAVTEPSQAAPLVVNPGDETGSLEIRLRSSPVYHVRGRVAFSDAGQPPTRCMLILQTQPGSWSGPARPVANYQPDGRFEFRAVPPGSYVLVGQTTEGENRRSGVVTLEVTRGSLDDVALLLSPGVTITASVTLEGGTRALSSAARLSLAAADWTPWGAPGGRAGNDGVFRLERIMPGRYRPEVLGAWPEAYLARVLWNEQDVPLTEAVEVTGAPATLRLVYRLDGGALQGVVRAGDKPASAGSVLLLPVDEAKRQAPWVRLQPLREDGGFALQAIAPGDYYVLSAESIEAGDWDDPEWLRRALAKAQRVSVSARSDASLRLEQEQ